MIFLQKTVKSGEETDVPDNICREAEPLLEFNLLEECVAYAKALFQGKLLSFTITTNATMLTEEIMEFLVGNDFYVTISPDGSKEIQDKNRVMAGGNK